MIQPKLVVASECESRPGSCQKAPVGGWRLGLETGRGRSPALRGLLASNQAVCSIKLPFAALHQLCAQLLARLDGLPGPQRDALAATFGLSAGVVPDRVFVGLAVLGLLSDAAEVRPLLWVIDDAQWLDRASAQCVAFVARRLLAESVVMLFAAREQSELFAGLPEVVVEGLRGSDARSLLVTVIPGRLDERVADELLAKTWVQGKLSSVLDPVVHVAEPFSPSRILGAPQLDLLVERGPRTGGALGRRAPG